MSRQLLLTFTLLTVACSSQIAPTKPSQSSKSSPPTEMEITAVVDALDKARVKLSNCIWDLIRDDKDKANPKNIEAAKQCREEQKIEIGRVYKSLASKPEILEQIIASEIDMYYGRSAFNSRFSEPGTELTAKKHLNELQSQSELNRVIVIQNQRIIELLEDIANR